MKRHAAVVGAGVLGRLLALRLAREGWAVTLFDRDDERGTAGCTWTGAGMISPYCEREAAQAMEMGFDAVLVNSAIALARDHVAMARAFADAVRAGRAAFEAGLMQPRDLASPSTPTVGTPFWHYGRMG